MFFSVDCCNKNSLKKIRFFIYYYGFLRQVIKTYKVKKVDKGLNKVHCFNYQQSFDRIFFKNLIVNLKNLRNPLKELKHVLLEIIIRIEIIYEKSLQLNPKNHA